MALSEEELYLFLRKCVARPIELCGLGSWRTRRSGRMDGWSSVPGSIRMRQFRSAPCG
ncbi:MAG: hypothetical protein ACE5R6_01970 [Candidatus Heimdallarchaeota archaeon]